MTQPIQDLYYNKLPAATGSMPEMPMSMSLTPGGEGMPMQAPDQMAPETSPMGGATEGGFPDVFSAENTPDLGSFELPEFAAEGGRIGMKEGGSPDRLTAQMLYQYIMEKTGDKKLAAMLTGNAAVESGFNPYVMHDKNTGFGLWGHGKDRWRDMQRFTGEAKPGWKQQADFAIHEMMESPKAALARKALQMAKNPQEIAMAGMHFERPQGYTPQHPESGLGFNKRLGYINNIYSTGDASQMKFSSVLPSMAAKGSYGYIAPSSTGYKGSDYTEGGEEVSEGSPLPMGEGNPQQPFLLQILEEIFGGIGDLLGLNGDQQQPQARPQTQSPSSQGQPTTQTTTPAEAPQDQPKQAPTQTSTAPAPIFTQPGFGGIEVSPPASTTSSKPMSKADEQWENRPQYDYSKPSEERVLLQHQAVPHAPQETTDMNKLLPQQGFSMFGVPDENPLFSFDEVTAKAPQQEMRKGGRLRKKFATDGSVEGGEEDAEQTETAADEPVARTEEPAPKADVDGSVEYAPSDFVLPSSIQKKQPGFGNFEQEWRNDPLSQLLWNLGVQLVKNDRLPLDQAFMAAAPYAIKGLGDAIDYQRALEQKKAEAQHGAEFMRRLYPEGMESGGIVRKKYATNGAVMDEGGDFFGDLGSLFGGEEQQPAPRHGHAAPAQPQQGFDILGSLFGGEEEQQPRAGRAQPMAYAPQQDPIGGFFDSIFGPEEQPQPARKGAAQPQYQPESSSNFLDDILGGIFGGGEQPRLSTQPMVQPRTPEKATGAPATPEKPAIAEPKTAAPPTTTPATGDKATTPAAPAAPTEPAKPEASGSIFNNPQVKQIDNEMRRVRSLYSQVQTEADAKAIRQRMADLNSQRQQTLNMLKDERDRADRLAKEANKPKPLTPEEVLAKKQKIIDYTEKSKERLRGHAELEKQFTEDTKASRGARSALSSLNEMIDVYKNWQPGAYAPLEAKLDKYWPQWARDMEPESIKGAQSSYEKAGKEAMMNMFDQLKQIGGQIRVAEMDNLKRTLATSDMTPDSVRKILAQAKAFSESAQKYERDRVNWIEKNPDYTRNEFDKWNQEWLDSPENNIERLKKEKLKEVHVKGETEDAEEKETASGSPSGGTPGKSEGQPKYSIQPGYVHGDYVYKGGDPNDRSNWERK
jgi:cell division septation protein DedD